MPQTRSHSSTDWVITWNGILFQGFANDDKFEVTRNHESAQMDEGPDGDVVIIRNNKRSGKLKCVLQAESPTNALLSAQIVKFEDGTGGTGPMLIRNTNQPATKAKSAVGVIEKWPDMKGGAKNGPCEYVILLSDVSMFFGGAVR